MIGRLVHSADFKRLLATPSRSRSTHFALHHLLAGPTPPAKPAIHRLSTELSTEETPSGPTVVDNFDGQWLGSVIPKRHARRSVTRNLLRRQIRDEMGRRANRLPPGLWLVRLRTPFSPQQFPSAASDALRQAARVELEHLFDRVERVSPARTA